jgi:hypothetical protein
LAAIFKNNFRKITALGLIQAPLKAAENKQPAALAHPILTSPMKHKYQTSSHIPISASTPRNTPLPLRVVTTMTDQESSSRVPARTQNLFPRNLSQDDFWNAETANQVITLGANHRTQQHVLSRSSTISGWQENGVHGTPERPRLPTSLKKRL